MNLSHQKGRFTLDAHALLPARNKSYSAGILLALLLTLCVARADGPDDDYLVVLGVVDQADTLSASGKTSQAHAKYLEAQRALAQFQQANPGWNSSMVSYRVKYVAAKAAATSEPFTASDLAAAAKKPVAVPSPVKVLDAGSEPRTVLRLHPGAGDKQTVTMTLKTEMTMALADKPMPSTPMPAMQLTMDIGVKDVAADGEITYDLLLGEASVVADTNTVPAMAAALKTALAGIQGMNGTGRMSSRGIIKGLEMKMPAGADPQFSQITDQMKDSFAGSSTALPEEAVGPGARWEYKTKLKSQGMTIDQTITYELVSIDGDRVTFRDTVTQSAVNQKIQSPAMPGAKLDLNRMTGTGTGGGLYDLTHIMPLTNTIDEKTEVSMGMNMGQQKQNMDMKMAISVTLEAK